MLWTRTCFPCLTPRWELLAAPSMPAELPTQRFRPPGLRGGFRIRWACWLPRGPACSWLGKAQGAGWWKLDLDDLLRARAVPAREPDLAAFRSFSRGSEDSTRRHVRSPQLKAEGDRERSGKCVLLGEGPCGCYCGSQVTNPHDQGAALLPTFWGEPPNQIP